MRYSKELTCSFSMCDPAGVLFFANAHSIAHQTIEEFLVHIGINYQQWFLSEHWIVPIRSASADYLHPIKLNEKLNSILQINKIGNSSIEFECHLNLLDQTNCAIVKTTHVFVDKKTLKARSVPDTFKEKLQRYLIINPAKK